MRKSRFTETQIIGTLKEVESGRTGQEVCREHGISEQTLAEGMENHGTAHLAPRGSDARCGFSKGLDPCFPEAFPPWGALLG